MGSPRIVFRKRAWLFALSFGLFAYLFHRVGIRLGFYPRFFWFQMVAHYVSAAGMALLLARFGLDLGLRGRWLVGVVVAFSLVGAVGWEVVEYLKLMPGLNWHGVDDSLLDLGMDGLGVATVLLALRTRLRRVVDPTVETPSLRVLAGGEPPAPPERE